MGRLNNQAAIITGGGTGIGRGVAQALAQEGVLVALCGRRPAPLEAAAAEITRYGGTALAIPADVSSEADVDHLVKAVLDSFGRVDILVNNAGVYRLGDAQNDGLEAWDEVMDVNLRGPFLMMRSVLPGMRAQKSGHIINISSESALNFYPGDVAYGLSKHALNDLGEFVQRENQEYGIRVNTICPGMVATEMVFGSPGLDLEKCLVPEDIADLVIWLLTRRSNVKIGTPILIQTMLNPWE